MITVEEYLEGELHSQVRHEYVEGHVYAMAGTTTITTESLAISFLFFIPPYAANLASLSSAI
jgi:hypothetical protein